MTWDELCLKYTGGIDSLFIMYCKGKRFVFYEDGVVFLSEDFCGAGIRIRITENMKPEQMDNFIQLLGLEKR